MTIIWLTVISFIAGIIGCILYSKGECDGLNKTEKTIFVGCFITIIICAIAMCTTGCVKDRPAMSAHDRWKLEKNSLYDYQIVEIDGCEYIYFVPRFGNTIFMHKANCKNCKQNVTE